MSDILRDAWKLYREQSAFGWAEIKRGEQAVKEAAGIPVNTKVSVWYTGSEMVSDAIQVRAKGYAIRLAADRLWRDAVVKEKGDIKVTWDLYNDVWRCTLETGEVFE